MIIDFHTHAYADSIAQKAMATLKSNASLDAIYTDGTINGLRTTLQQSKIDYAALLPIATKPTQTATINRWAKENNKGMLFSFGTIHPDEPKPELVLENLLADKLFGIKIHPDYQGVFLFDARYHAIFSLCAEKEIPVVIHMGYDPVSPLVRHAMPAHLREVHDKYPKLKLVAAHFGGMLAWEEVLHYLAGQENIWLDTAFTAGFLPPALMCKMIEKHGTEYILFGSDCPWHSPKDELALIDSLPITSSQKEKILWQNALALLGLTTASLANRK